MSTTQGTAAPESGIQPDFELEALLQFEPAPRQNKRRDGWTPALQRKFITKLAETGSPTLAAEALGKNRHGVEKVYKAEGADGFRAAWDRAVELFEEREAERAQARYSPFAGQRAPGIDRRRKAGGMAGPLPGQVMNEQGEWEDEASLANRYQQSMANIADKILRARRLYLQEICDSPGKRAAFEILTQYPIDWDKAARLEPQADEPYKDVPNMRNPDMLLTAEAGWLHDWGGYGVDRMGAMREALNKHRVEQGLEAIDWSESTDG